MTRVSAPTVPAPRVDVLMTAYNAALTIESAVLSILNQDFPAFRLIVVDDGSTDATHDRLSELVEQDDRIIVIRQANRGIVGAANRGLQVCTAEYIARFDADDLAYQSRLRLQVEHLDANPTCVAVSGLVRHIDALGKPIGSMAGSLDISGVDPNAVPAREPYIMHPFVMLRRDALQKVGGYRHVDLAEDTDLYWRLLNVGTLQVIGDFVGEYRIHQSSITSRSTTNARISAINSQLAAISQQRRLLKRSDLAFSAEDMAKWRESPKLSEMLDLAETRLLTEERERYRLCVAAKLLELNTYKPFNLDPSDCSTIKTILIANKEEIVRNNHRVTLLWAAGVARLAVKGFPRRAKILWDPCINRLFLQKSFMGLAERIMPAGLSRRYKQSKALKKLIRSGSTGDLR